MEQGTRLDLLQVKQLLPFACGGNDARWVRRHRFATIVCRYLFATFLPLEVSTVAVAVAALRRLSAFLW